MAEVYFNESKINSPATKVGSKFSTSLLYNVATNE